MQLTRLNIEEKIVLSGFTLITLPNFATISIPLKDCTLIVGPILTLTLWALLLADIGGAYRRSVEK